MGMQAVRNLLALLLAAIPLCLPQAGAFEFSPIIAQFAPSGPGAARTFTVQNTQPDTVALQIEVYARSADETGNETRTPDHDSFIITPPQLVLTPGAGRSVRAQWIGDPAPQTEQAFRIIVSQIPIRFSQDIGEADTSASVAIAYRYEVAAYVAPPGAVPRAELVSAVAVSEPDGARRLRLLVRSTGTMRAILTDPVLRLETASGQQLVLEKERLAPLEMRNILSGTQALIDLPWPEELPFGDVAATLQTGYFTFD